MHEMLAAEERIKQVYIAPSGRVWHLAGAGAGREGVVSEEGMQGHLAAPMALLSSKPARANRASYLRTAFSPKEGDFVAIIGGEGMPLTLDKPRDFLAVHRAWLADWPSRAAGTMGWFTRSSGWTFERVRRDGPPVPLSGTDPLRSAHDRYQMSYVALDPFAKLLDEPQQWTNSFGLGEGFLPMRNPGSEEGWPRYTFGGPGRVWIGDPVNGDTARMIQSPLIADGEELRINTDPRERTARVHSDAAPSGRNVMGQMRGRRFFFAIPPGETYDVPIRVSDGATVASTVRGTLTPSVELVY